MSVELKPCPFCGAECDDCVRDDGEGFLGCSDQKCPAHILAMTHEQWNRRPSTGQTQEQKEADKL